MDEASTEHRYAYKAHDCSARVVMCTDLQFGCKQIEFGGDSWQIRRSSKGLVCFALDCEVVGGALAGKVHSCAQV